MCGISGLINLKKDKVSLSEVFLCSELNSMNDSMSHRGPDADGIYTFSRGGFGHRRLSIIDLSEDANQPMQDTTGLVITYNGEIYNYIELRKKLIQKGYSFSTESDTEVIIKAYDHWGSEFVHKLNGMWAFAIYDPEKQTVFISRDRFGVKPLYYSFIGEKLYFASEIKALLPKLDSITANEEVLLEYMISGHSNYSKETFFQNIFQLRGGHNLVIDLLNNDYSISKYYDLYEESNKRLMHQKNSLDDIQQTFEDAVRIRLRSDVPVGSCLSGGLDSSTIVSYASSILSEQKEKYSRIFAIHAKSSDSSNDESGFALKVSKQTNADLTVIEPTVEDFIDNIKEVVIAQEEPFNNISIILQFLVMKEAGKKNMKVLLDGQGADETWLGYERYYVSTLQRRNLLSFVNQVRKISKNSKLGFLQTIFYFIYFSNRYFHGLFKRRRSNFLKKRFVKTVSFFDSLSLFGKSSLEDQCKEICVSQLPRLLMYEDKNSMWHSIETRLPFMDYRLVETSVSSEMRLKIHQGWTKYSIRKIASKYLDDEIAWRKEKVGFEGPTTHWLNENKEMIYSEINTSEILSKYLSSDVKLDNLEANILWRLFSLAMWSKSFNVKAND